jgi:hypothetical protein
MLILSRKLIKKLSLGKQEESEAYKIFEYTRSNESCLEVQLETKVLNNILKQISNCSEFLIEDKLQALILNRSEDEKTIIRLDNIFQVCLFCFFCTCIIKFLNNQTF